ncbi:hypothetical protein D9M69_649670 [compost metagenome]
MRQVGHGLDELLELLRAQFVQHQREDDGHREAEQQRQYAQDDGVLERLPETGIVDEQRDVLQPHPFLTEDAAAGLELPECDHVARHGQVAEDREVQQWER